MNGSYERSPDDKSLACHVSLLTASVKDFVEVVDAGEEGTIRDVSNFIMDSCLRSGDAACPHPLKNHELPLTGTGDCVEVIFASGVLVMVSVFMPVLASFKVIALGGSDPILTMKTSTSCLAFMRSGHTVLGIFTGPLCGGICNGSPGILSLCT